MKLSTKGRYGLRAIIDLAVHSEHDIVSISNICEREGISESYMEQLIAKLKKAGLVTSIRGACGGYKMAKPLETISVGDILRALEGELTMVDCPELNGNGESDCQVGNLCVTKYVWQKVNDAINDTFDSISLKELVDESKKVMENQL